MNHYVNDSATGEWLRMLDEIAAESGDWLIAATEYEHNEDDEGCSPCHEWTRVTTLTTMRG